LKAIRIAFALMVGVTVAGCGGQETGAVLPAEPPATCPITKPPTPAFVPGGSYPSQPSGAGQFWYGTSDLWTALPADGTWRDLPREAGAYGQKIFFWEAGYDATKEPHPQVAVAGSRLDQAAERMLASKGTNAMTETGDAMLVGAAIPSAGCWEITAEHGGHVLRFVVWVAP
jgi:hypothetical protein